MKTEGRASYPASLPRLVGVSLRTRWRKHGGIFRYADLVAG